MTEQDEKTQEQKNDNSSFNLTTIVGGLIIGMGIVAIVAGIKNMSEPEKHKNVIVKKDGTKMLVRDVETGEKRIIKDVHMWGAPPQNFEKNDWRYVPVGDTIFIQTTIEDYKQNKVLTGPIVSFQHDSVSARKKRENFNTLKQSIMNEKQR